MLCSAVYLFQSEIVEVDFLFVVLHFGIRVEHVQIKNRLYGTKMK